MPSPRKSTTPRRRTRQARVIRVRVRGDDARYDVRVEPGLIGRVGGLVRGACGAPVPAVAALVSDRTVMRLYGAPVEQSLRRAGLRVVRSAIAPGERSKRVDTARALAEAWARAGLTRETVVVALGGGVVSDTAGFAAAVYGRGVRWVGIPTTVLAQADAAIGGKVGVNLTSGKNLFGAFHQPRAVLADTDTLATLPGRAFRSGLAEIVKMGVIRRPEILRGLNDVADSLAGSRAERAEALASLAPLIHACAAAKAWYVARDERDTGLRRELNFGHTVGHALEAAAGYATYEHGEAVSIGMVAALRLSVLHAGLNPAEAQDVERLLRRLGLPTRIPRPPGDRFWAAFLRDKKRGRTRPRMVLCPAIGTAEVFELSSLTSLRRVLFSLVMRSRA